MGHGSGAALLHGQAGLGAIKRLDLALFVNRQHQRIVRRIEIKPNDILNFLCKLRIVRELERAREMGLQAVLLPHALDGGVANADLFGQHARAPMRGVRGLLLGGHGDDPEPHRIGDARLSGFRTFALIFAQALDAAFQVGFLPAPDGGLRNPRFPRDRHCAKAPSGQKHDARTHRQLLRSFTTGNETLQHRPVTGRDV
jgi:hypothetical protein